MTELSSNFTREKGFTLIELMVSTTIISILMAMLVGYVLSMQDYFFEDIVRTRINSNLRSAFDIIGMNVRQSGENLQRSFPAVLISADSDSTGQYLTLRRNLIPEILTVCTLLNGGSSTVEVSSTTSTEANCQYSNVTTLYNAFNTERVANGGSTRLFIYDSLTKSGEFVDYTGGSAATNYTLNISTPALTYQPLTTYLYILEEYAFSLKESTKTLNLYRDGRSTTPEAVAFLVSEFSISVYFNDGTSSSSLSATGSYRWKDIKKISMVLTGTEAWKSRTFSTSVNGDFFPRNVISR